MFLSREGPSAVRRVYLLPIKNAPPKKLGRLGRIVERAERPFSPSLPGGQVLGIALVDRPPWTGRCRRQHLLGVGWAHQLNGRSMGGNMTTEHHTATSYLSGPSPRRRGAPMPVVGADEQILRPHRCTRRAPVRAGECSRGVRRRRPGTPGPGPCASGGHGQVHQEEALGVGGCWGKSPPARGGPSPPARGTSAKALPGRAPKASPREHRVRSEEHTSELQS